MFALHIFKQEKVNTIRIVQMPHSGNQNEPNRMQIFSIRAYKGRKTSPGTYFANRPSPGWYRPIDFDRWTCLRKRGILYRLDGCEVHSDSTLHNRCLLEPIFSSDLGEKYWSSNYGLGEHWIEIRFSQPRLLNTLAIMWKGSPQAYYILLHSYGRWKEVFRSKSREAITILKFLGRNRKINSIAKWEARREEIKRNILKIMKPFPTEKCSPNVKVISRRRVPDGRLTEIAYRPEPGHRLHAYIVFPTKTKPPYPLVVYAMYNRDEALAHALPLLKRGFALFTPDILIDQGRVPEGHPYTLQTSIMRGLYGDGGFYRRDKLWRCLGPRTWITKPGWEKKARWSGMGKIIWDVSRGLDVVLSMPEIDAHRVGCTGFSWGGIHTMYITAFDDRISVASPQCCIGAPMRWARAPGDTSATWYHLPDLAQYFREDTISKVPFDTHEVLALAAPRPVLVVEESRGAPNVTEAMEEVRKVYALYGAEDRFVVRSPDDAHAYYLEGFDWFERWL